MRSVFGKLSVIKHKDLICISECRKSVCDSESGSSCSELVDSILNELFRLGIEGGGCTPDGKFSLEACRCIGACGLAPVLTVNEDVFGRLTVDDVDKIIEKYNA